MAFAKHEHAKCPQCHQNEIYIIESRKTRDATRRRRECKSCGYRDTTYEISSHFYVEAEKNAQLVKKFRALLSIGEIAPITNSKGEIKCDTCSHNTRSKCSFDFPEFLTEDSIDCNHFST